MKEKICPDCNGLIKIRNPTGKCDHLYYPENKKKSVFEEIKESIIASIKFSKDFPDLKERLGSIIEEYDLEEEDLK